MSRRPSLPTRAGALVLASLLLLSACTPAGPQRPSLGHGSAQREEGPRFVRLPTDFAPVRVGEAEFSLAMAGVLLEMPLRVEPSRLARYASRSLASVEPKGEAWRSELARDYGGFCERRGTPGDCLGLFDDAPRVREDDKLRIALALAVGPALEGLDAEVRAMIDPRLLLVTLSGAIVGYMALILAPEPVSKGVALTFTLLLWGYLGWEFFDLVRAYARLSEEAERASTFEELRAAGARFGMVIGPNSARILVMVGTAAVGETAALMSRASKLPGFGQVAPRVKDAATGAERVILSVPEGTVSVVMAPNVAAMAARGGGSGRSASNADAIPRQGKLLPSGHRAFKSFKDFKNTLGPAGKDQEWHHIVEQCRVDRFGPEAIHNTENVIPLGKRLNRELNRLYSSIRPDITNSRGQTVRQWLSTQSYDAQRQFGLRAIENVKAGVWP